jgi:hypothetical protein
LLLRRAWVWVLTLWHLDRVTNRVAELSFRVKDLERELRLQRLGWEDWRREHEARDDELQ